MKRILRLLNTGGGRILIFLLLAVPVLAMFVPARFLIEIGDAFVLPMAIAAAGIYALQIWRQPESRPIDGIDIVMIGIMGAWFVNFLDRGMRLTARLFDRGLQDAWPIGLFLALMTLFAACHILNASVRRNPESLPVNGQVIIYWALGTGALLAVVVTIIELAHPLPGPSRY